MLGYEAQEALPDILLAGENFNEEYPEWKVGSCLDWQN